MTQDIEEQAKRTRQYKDRDERIDRLLDKDDRFYQVKRAAMILIHNDMFEEE